MTVRYLQRPSSGPYRFRMGIPKDLREFYGERSELVHSLQTRDESEAIRKVQQYAKRYRLEFERLRASGERDRAVVFLQRFGLNDAPLDRQAIYGKSEEYDEMGSPYWALMEHLSGKHDMGDHYAPAEPFEQRALDILNDKEQVLLSEIRARLLATTDDKKDSGEIKRFFAYFEDRLAVTEIREIRTRDIRQVTDKLLAEGLKTTTVKKALNFVKKQVGETIIEYDLNIKNPFDGIKIKNVGADSEKRHSYDYNELQQIKSKVQKSENQVTAQIVALLFNTGCRCGEIGGIKLNDIRTDDEIPHLKITSGANRSLKNKNSERSVPLGSL